MKLHSGVYCVGFVCVHKIRLLIKLMVNLWEDYYMEIPQIKKQLNMIINSLVAFFSISIVGHLGYRIFIRGRNIEKQSDSQIVSWTMQ